MDIYEYAMQMEKDGEEYYRELAGKCKLDGIRTILIMLADEEVKHCQTIALLQKHTGNSSVAKTPVLEKVKNVFISLRDAKVAIRFDSSDLDAYRKAMTIEEMSRAFYQDKAATAEDANEKQIFLRLAGEEEKHRRIMENLVEFVARPEPGHWLENAEWHHLDEY